MRDDFRLKDALMQIESTRVKLGITRDNLTNVAGLSNGYYWRVFSGKKSPNRGTVNALRLALRRLEIFANIDCSVEARLVNTLIRAAIGLICEARGINAELIQQQDPNRRATASKEWKGAAEVRNEAWALVNNAFGVSGVQIARAANVSRAAVSIALKKIENNRDDPEYEQFHDRLERALTGGGW